MSKKVKIIGSVLALFVLLCVGLFFFVSSKIKPEEIKKLTIETIEKSLPGATASLGTIDYSLGFTVKLGFKDLMIKLKEKDQSEIVSVKEFQVKVPIWSIITNGGTIDVSLQNPHLSLVEYDKDSTNLKLALGNKKPEEAKKESTAKSEEKATEELKLPQFVLNSKINVRVNDIALKMKKFDGSKTDLHFNRVLLKDINLKKSTAFEIESDLHLTSKEGQKIETNVLAIGQVNLNEYVEQNVINLSTLVNVTKTNISGMKHRIPDVKSQIKVLITKEGKISVDTETNVGSLATAVVSIELMEKILKVKTLKVDLFLKEVNSIVDPTLKESLSKIDFNNSTLSLNGEVTLNDGNLENTNLNFALSPEIILNGAEGLKITTALKGSFKNEQLAVYVVNKAMDGIINVDVKGRINPMQKDFSVEKLGPIYIDIVASNAKFTTEMIRKTLYSKSTTAPVETNEATASTVVAKKAQPIPPRKLPNVIVDAKWKQIIIGKEEFFGSAKIVTLGSSINSENINFQFSKGKGSLNFSSKQLPSMNIDNKFGFSMTNLNLNSLQAFLPPMLENLKGDFSGDVKGAFLQTPTVGEYNVNFSLNAVNGELKGLNLNEQVLAVISKVDLLKDKIGKKDIKFDDQFEKLVLKGDVNNKTLTVSTFEFTGIKNSTSITGKGFVGMPLSKKDSLMDLVYIDKSGVINQFMTKNVGTDQLPLKLKGIEFALSPDYAYTISSLAKGALKTKGKEEVKKVAEKVIDKVIKNDEIKQKAGNLLKGLFK